MFGFLGGIYELLVILGHFITQFFLKSSFHTALISKLYQTWDESQKCDKDDLKKEENRSITEKSNGNNWFADISI